MWSGLLLVTLIGCAHTLPKPTVRALSEEYELSRRQVRRFHKGISVAESAAGLIGARRLRGGNRTFRYDCSGLVNAAYARAGIDLDGLNTAALFQRAKKENRFHRRKNPRPGDIAFFDNTWDRNGDRRLNDRLTHVAIVEKVDDNGTITLIHNGGKGVKRTYMNLRHKGVNKRDGVLLNSFLRYRRSNDRRRTKYLTGELWRGFASFWRDED
ncbi:MAG: CHAP domain-containing protein [Myxococcota bacterium]